MRKDGVEEIDGVLPCFLTPLKASLFACILKPQRCYLFPCFGYSRKRICTSKFSVFRSRLRMHVLVFPEPTLSEHGEITEVNDAIQIEIQRHHIYLALVIRIVRVINLNAEVV